MWRRAVKIAVKLAMVPPDTRMPPASSGYPTNSAIQRRHWASIAAAAGPRLQAPALVFVQAASASAKIPIMVPEPLTWAKCRGRAHRGQPRRDSLAPVRDQRLGRLPFRREAVRERHRDLGRRDVRQDGAAVEAGVILRD